MKKILISIVLVAATAAFATNPVKNDFINGATLELTNSTAYSYADSGIVTYAFPTVGGAWNGQSLSAFWSRGTSNILATVGQSGTNWVPFVAYLTNRAAFSSTNQVAGGYINNTNVIQPYAWVDVPAFCDGNAQYGQGAFTVTAALDSAAGTNKLTLVWQRLVDGEYPDDSVNKVTLIMPVYGITNNTYTTNLPSTFATGAQKYRLQTVTVADSTTNKWVYVKSITLGGWSKP